MQTGCYKLFKWGESFWFSGEKHLTETTFKTLGDVDRFQRLLNAAKTEDEVLGILRSHFVRSVRTG